MESVHHVQIPPTPPQCHYGEEIHLWGGEAAIEHSFCFISVFSGSRRHAHFCKVLTGGLYPDGHTDSTTNTSFRPHGQLDLDYCSEDPGAFSPHSEARSQREIYTTAPWTWTTWRLRQRICEKAILSDVMRDKQRERFTKWLNQNLRWMSQCMPAENSICQFIINISNRLALDFFTGLS